jgi:pilus assembly protein CpaF
LIKASAGDSKARKYIEDKIRNKLKIDYKNEYSKNNMTEEIEADVREIFNISFGSKGIQQYLDRKDINELMIRGKKVFIEIEGVIHPMDELDSVDEAEEIIKKIVSENFQGEINKINAEVETRNENGDRVKAMLPPVAEEPILSVRMFNAFDPTLDNMLKNKTMSSKMANFITFTVKNKTNNSVIGGMGSGKTALLEFMISLINAGESIVVIQNPFEITKLSKKFPHLVVSNLQVTKRYTAKDLIISALRLNATRIILTEARGDEMNEVIKAKMRGHKGSMSSSHSLSAEDMIDDNVDMILESGKTVADINPIKRRVCRADDLVYKMEKLGEEVDENGRRFRRRVLSSISEILIDDNFKITTNVIFEYNRELDEFIWVNPISDTLAKELEKNGAPLEEIAEWQTVS